MAEEYINKKDVIDLGVMMQTHLWTREQTYKAIFCLPSADVAPVRRGKWMETGAYPHRVYCSVCSKTYAQAHWEVWKDGSLARTYCPNCGAKMDEGGNNGTDNK